jgi:cardiolipin synthase A/B
MVAREFVGAVLEARKRFTCEQWAVLVEGIGRQAPDVASVDIGTLLSDASSSDGVWLLNRSLQLRGACSWSQVAAVLATVAAWPDDLDQDTEVVWTGPSNGVFPVRRFEQVLYDLITQAKNRILIVTFAAYRVEHLCKCLSDAQACGVNLTLVLEGEEDSAGQLTFDAVKAFKTLTDRGLSIYGWPLDHRERNAAGRPGKLHAKCAVIDNIAIVGSGNLTEDAFNRNMELGLMTKDELTADAIYRHFTALIEKRELRDIRQ